MQASSAGLLVWGDKSVTTIPAAALEAILEGTHVEAPVEAQAPDWIYDGSLSPYDPWVGVLITAHNEIVSFSVDSVDNRHVIVFGEVISPSRPILYSGAVSWTAEGCVLVAAGTVFGEIVVWECCLDAESSSRSEVLFVLTGHEGSIFGVDISPEVELTTGSKTRLLASCSDDRTIRVWDITRGADLARTIDGAYIKSLGEARETGFTARSEIDASRCLAATMGHGSRIWHVRFACPTGHTGTSMSPVSVYSFGEDATAQKWELCLGEDRPTIPSKSAVLNSANWLPGALNNVEKFVCHKGKHIWSAAVTTAGESDPLVATGGADGKITLLGWVDKDVAADSTNKDNNCRNGSNLTDGTVSLSYQDVSESISGTGNYLPDASPIVKKTAKNGFLRYVFLSEDRLLVSTKSGRTLVGNMGKELSWAEVDVSDAVREDLKSHIISRSPGFGAAFLGSTSGRLYLFREEHGMQEVATFPGKIADLLFLPKPSERADTAIAVGPGVENARVFTILVTILGSTQGTLLTVAIAEESTSVERLPICLDKGVATSAAICGDFMVIGTRSGVVAVYTRTPDGFARRASRLDCKNKDAVTSIATLPPLDGDTATGFLATFRDGNYRIYEIHGDEDEVALILRHETSPPLGPILEGAWFAQTPNGDLDLVICGFRSRSFVMWNETKQQEIADVECGGGHRTFDYVSNRDNMVSMRFVYTKASYMDIYSQSRMSLRTLRPGSHGREIRAVATNGKYLATGGEDTCIRIWEYAHHVAPPEDLRCLAVLEKHTAGVRCLKWYGEEYLISCSGNEEVYVWRVTSLRSKYKGLAVICEAVFSDFTPLRDLRIMDFVVGEGEEDDDGMHISMTFSNSSLKTYRYSQDRGFELLAEGLYTGACLTQIRHLRLPGGAMRVLTASTDGHVAIWKDEKSTPQDKTCDISRYTLVLATKLHQNTIISLDIRDDATEGGISWQVVTSGDDNALGILDIAWRGEHDSLTVTNRARVKDAHAAAVTSAVIMERAGPSTLVATVSNDQRIKVWRIEKVPGKGNRVALIENQYSAIADPGDLEVFAPGKLMVAGVGMESWSWPPRSII